MHHPILAVLVRCLYQEQTFLCMQVLIWQQSGSGGNKPFWLLQFPWPSSWMRPANPGQDTRFFCRSVSSTRGKILCEKCSVLMKDAYQFQH
ncbi:ORF1071 [White spot syndrome virus]|uniref:Wsv227 n=3 Tax=White spot syndrome virus TaxID=342409 RepID=Q8VAY9_WSSVS|nr:wsv227 [Shrimp white spot syndrome virus]AFX59604.1 wsv227 [White spot syndrome virus]AAL33231.1 wsv227 [Shrimp white spot syndrome virus]AAL89150.1 WSSV282 [Shrimp white spot syndrome virus]ATU83736.1 ORF1071 [White spot syndrome virus]AWQ60398.1 wsv227 [Shrimp white spot syndrome virus]